MSDRLREACHLITMDRRDRKPGLEQDVLWQAIQLLEAVERLDVREAETVKRVIEGLPQAWTNRTAIDVPQWKGRRGRNNGLTMRLNDVVKVAGLGKRTGAPEDIYGGRSDSAGWKVTGIAQRGDEVNVVVLKNGVERTVRLDRIR